MQPGGFEVDVEALRGIGRNVVRVAETLREAVKAAGSGLAPAGQSGSAAAAAAQAAEKVWLADLRRLTAQVEECGKSLVTAAHDYRGTDEANAHGVRRSGAGLGR
ncbi:type VII secretion target [Actinoplanes sp. NPDC049548]|uniref:type VII secretion target n=1 Tax=Actinoplanes sp. NPDC049548 TaxID=3155152 RepID=UPI003422764D